MVTALTDSVGSKHSEAPGTADWSVFRRSPVNSSGFRAPAGCSLTLASPPPLLIGCSSAKGGGVGDLALRHFRLLSAAAAVFSECGGERAEGAGIREAGWAGRVGGRERKSHHGDASLDVPASSDTVGSDRRRVTASSREKGGGARLR